MEHLCPECLGALDSVDGQTARCTIHGGTFKILFAREALAMPFRAASAPPPLLAQGATCVQHPSVAALHACAGCGNPICGVCDFEQPDGSHRCPVCAQRQAAAPPVLPSVPAAPLPAGVHCVQHPNLPATGQCKVCGGYMCNTCAFDLPGGIKLCPSCATNPQTALSSKRKKQLIGSFALALWSTVVMAALMGGAFHDMVREPGGEQAAGLILLVFLLVPAATGMALALSAMERRSSHKMVMWLAAAWNGLIVAGFLLLSIIGSMR